MSEPWRRSRQTWWRRPSVAVVRKSQRIDVAVDLLLGTAKSKRSFKLLPSVSVMNGKLRLPWRALCIMYSISFAPLAPLA